MSEHGTKGMADCMFSRQRDAKLLNVKFFRGSNRIVRPDELRAELCAIAERKRSNPTGFSSDAPRSSRAKVDVRAFVANM